MLRDVEVIWMRFTHSVSTPDTKRQKEEERKGNYDPVPPLVTEYPYYVNLKTGLAHWAKPYSQHTFRSVDFEFDTFLKVS